MKNKFELTEEEKQIESEIDQYKSVSAEKCSPPEEVSATCLRQLPQLDRIHFSL
jgi:hypothetical protein